MRSNAIAFDSQLFKQQQSILVLLNLGVLAGLVLVHVSFLSLLGVPSLLLLIVVTGRFLALIAELLWLQSTGELQPSLVAIYKHLTIWVNIAFAFLVSYLAGSSDVSVISDSHYSVLMILPIISAASYFRLPATLAVCAVTIVCTFLQVWLFYRRHPPADVTEYFEAATVCLIFLVVTLVVWLLVSDLSREHLRLKQNLAELYATRDRLVAEEKLAAVGRLASGIAHEIRNPVAMISSSLTMATRYERDSPVRAEMFDVATQEAARLERMTSEFLEYARTKAPVKKPVSLADTLGYVASLGKAKAGQNNVEIRLNVASELKAVIDDTQIQQALLNLLTNAFEAMPSGGVVTLGAKPALPHAVTIYVEDTGHKISDEVAQRIFEPFFTTKQKGTGLGLSIVHNIAQSHGGTATLEINEPGRVRFSLSLPNPGNNLEVDKRSWTDGARLNS
ncbi:MAG TPA: ATP-binding protein [Pyrinomonadaceae bacterium]|jgi:signal transduction histidine kinase|nr:ATP-binding protein [Pyrinomonadaceae bacterium]